MQCREEMPNTESHHHHPVCTITPDSHHPTCHYPNHDLFRFASFLAFCYTPCQSSSLHSNSPNSPKPTHCSLQSRYALLTHQPNSPIVPFPLSPNPPRIPPMALTGRNPHTSPSPPHSASSTLYSCPQLLGTGRSTRCTLCWIAC